jgi:hypothetical protein
MTSLAESRHINRPSHGGQTSKPESDHRHGNKPVRSLIVKFLLTICGIQTYYSRYDTIDEHAGCARRYNRLNDKYEELKGKFSELR